MADLGLGAHRFFQPTRVLPLEDLYAYVVRDPHGTAHSCCGVDFEAEHGDFAALHKSGRRSIVSIER